MKKLLIFLIALVVLSATVSATLTMPGDILLGSDNERRSNSNADEERYQEWYVEKTFTLQSNATVNNVEVTLSGDITNSAKYNATLTASGATAITNGIKLNLAAGVPVSIKLKAMVPEDLDSIDSEFALLQNLIGTITADDKIGSTAATSVKMQAKNRLLLNNAKVCINGNSCKNMDDTDSLKDIKPGDTISFEIEVENDYSDDADKEDLTIENVEVGIESVDGDLEDADDSDDIGDVDSNTKETTTFEFDIADDADKKDYDVYVYTEGTDENGARHGERWTITLEVDRESHDLKVDSMTLEPEQAECGSTATLTVNINNIGRGDEDDVAVSIKSLSLSNLNKKSEYYDIDQDDDQSYKFQIDIPDNQKAGQYRIDVQTYYDKTKQSNSDAVILTVKCEAQEIVIPPAEETQYVQPGASVKATLAVPVTFVVKGAQHTLSVISYDASTESAVVVLTSTPQTMSLMKGVPQRADLDSDGKDDVQVTLVSVSQEGVLTVQVQEITYGAQAPSMSVTGSYTSTTPTSTTPTGAVVTEQESLIEGLFGGSSYVLTLAIVDIIILIVAIVLIGKAMRKK